MNIRLLDGWISINGWPAMEFEVANIDEATKTLNISQYLLAQLGIFKY
jgi:hypothetical protein